MANNIIVLYTSMFKQQSKVTENGLLVISGLINGVGKRVSLTEFGTFLTYALKNNGDEGATRLACGIVSDLTSAFGEEFAPHVEALVPLLFNILKSQEFDRDSKL